MTGTESGTVKVEELIRTVNRSALSRKTPISLSHISRVLSGDRMPSAPILRMLAKAMDVPMDDLYDYLSTHMRPRRRTRLIRVAGKR